ncbi:MAG: Transcriptional regulator, IclR [Solirubrobacterales bacterium]|nr:Transcriptional regulator, IclR [Solirubrobacterales bacterium]
MLNTVKKVGPVLELFTVEQPEWRMSDIARALDMPKSSVHSLVTTLSEIGLLSTSAQGRYRLGWNLLSLSERMRDSLDFRQHALPQMEELAKDLRETVLLAALDRAEVVYVERVEGRHPMVRLAGVATGARAPAHCTAVGKVMLAHRDAAEVRMLLTRAGMKAYTKRTITDLDAFEQEMIKVRAAGHALDLQEIVPEIACAAVPITNHYGTVVAAMSVSMPAYRFPTDRAALLSAMNDAALIVSRRIADA